MNRTGIRALVVTGAVAALLVTGCGSDDQGDDSLSPEETVSQLYAAAGDGDYEKVCSLISADGEASIIEGTKGADTCVEAAEKAFRGGFGMQLAQIEVGESTIDGETATVEISFEENTDAVALIQEDGSWKVDE